LTNFIIWNLFTYYILVAVGSRGRGYPWVGVPVGRGYPWVGALWTGAPVGRDPVAGGSHGRGLPVAGALGEPDGGLLRDVDF